VAAGNCGERMSQHVYRWHNRQASSVADVRENGIVSTKDITDILPAQDNAKDRVLVHAYRQATQSTGSSS